MPYSPRHKRDVVQSWKGQWVLEHDGETAEVLRALRRTADNTAVDWAILWEQGPDGQTYRVDMEMAGGEPVFWLGHYENGAVRHETRRLRPAGLQTIEYYPAAAPASSGPAFHAPVPNVDRSTIGAKLSEIVLHDEGRARGTIAYWRPDGSLLFTASCDDGRRMPGARVHHRTGAVAAAYTADIVTAWAFYDENGKRMPEVGFRAQYPLLHSCTREAKQDELWAALVGGSEGPRAANGLAVATR